jgi:hypothetical protein
MTDDKKGGQRFKEAAEALVTTGAGAAAAASLGPGGEVLGVAAVQLFKYGIGLLKQRGEHRIKAFHVALLEGTTMESAQALLARIASDGRAGEEYASILQKVAQDDEDAKVRLYAHLLRHLLSSDEHERVRRHLIRSVRELAVEDLDVLQKLSEIDGAWPENSSNPEADAPAHVARHHKFLHDADPLAQAAIQRLEHAGFIQGVQVGGGERKDVTELGHLLLKIVAAVPT